jgi:hypothetical protein
MRKMLLATVAILVLLGFTQMNKTELRNVVRDALGFQINSNFGFGSKPDESRHEVVHDDDGTPVWYVEEGMATLEDTMEECLQHKAGAQRIIKKYWADQGLNARQQFMTSMRCVRSETNPITGLRPKTLDD